MKDLAIPVTLLFRVRDDVDPADVAATVEAALGYSTIGESMHEAVTNAPWSLCEYDDDESDSYDGYSLSAPPPAAFEDNELAGLQDPSWRNN